APAAVIVLDGDEPGRGTGDGPTQVFWPLAVSRTPTLEHLPRVEHGGGGGDSHGAPRQGAAVKLHGRQPAGHAAHAGFEVGDVEPCPERVGGLGATQQGGDDVTGRFGVGGQPAGTDVEAVGNAPAGDGVLGPGEPADGLGEVAVGGVPV